MIESDQDDLACKNSQEGYKDTLNHWLNVF
jgi:hypothetical protein